MYVSLNLKGGFGASFIRHIHHFVQFRLAKEQVKMEITIEMDRYST